MKRDLNQSYIFYDIRKKLVSAHLHCTVTSNVLTETDENHKQWIFPFLPVNKLILVLCKIEFYTFSHILYYSWDSTNKFTWVKCNYLIVHNWKKCQERGNENMDRPHLDLKSIEMLESIAFFLWRGHLQIWQNYNGSGSPGFMTESFEMLVKLMWIYC